MVVSDFHTHTNYDHAHHTPAQMAAEAARLGMTALGLVGHSRMTIPCHYAMSVEGERQFFAECTALKTQYEGQMDVFCGIEMDYYAAPVDLPYDYRIGSVHYIPRDDGTFLSVDSKAEYLTTHANVLGGFLPLVQQYYESVAQIVSVTDCDIIAHFDLVTKFNEPHPLFSPEEPAFRRAALDAVDALLPYDRLFEINTGAISRGYRVTPYPAPFLLKHIAQRGGRILLSSDAHDISGLLFQFDQSAQLARSCGFSTVWTLTTSGFVEIPL